MVVSPYRITPDDLPGLKSDVRNGLFPLLDALNITIPQLVQGMGSVGEDYVPVVLTTGAAVADSFPLVFRHPLGVRPRGVFLANILPRDPDHLLTTPFVMQGFGLTANNLISVPWITGVLASNTYDLTFLIKS
jgi:hypothetical protein